ncbi:MAG TPA: ABC transporter ATP-binding protein [Pseudonocardiaceae bacterium]|nr:ABC transporter ATP-binding protein [Pseudonocardiaceae bacterium]
MVGESPTNERITMTPSESSGKPASGIFRFLATDVPAAALRQAGNRVLRQSLGQAPSMVVLLGLATVVSVATTVLIPHTLGAAIDAAGDSGKLSRALVQLGVVFAVGTAATILDDVISFYWGSHVTVWLRCRLVDRGLRLGVAGQRRFPAGDLLTRLTENASSPASFLPILASAATTLLTTIGAVVALMLIDIRIGITFLVGAVPLAALFRQFVSEASRPFLRYQQLLADIMTRLLDAHRGIRTIRASGTISLDVGRILQPLPELHSTGRRTWAAQRQVSWQLSLLGPILQVLVLSVGGFVLAAGGITAGQLVAAAAYVTLALGSVGLFDTLVALLTTQVGAGRVGEVLETTPTIQSPSRPAALVPGPGQVQMRGISVAMEQRTVLDHLDLLVPAGTSMAVVGRSGTGKTLLTSLIGRLLDPDDGEVLLDGVPVSHLDLGVLRKTVTYAFERPALLGATVHDMIAYTRPDASRAEVAAAAKVAQADRFIRSLPEGYETPLADAPLSGGELQRLGLARAVLADARVVVLDDATSSLDTATEMKVTEALAEVLADRTSVVVAHRAATAARADLVAWLDAGQIRALAPHYILWSDPSYRAVFGVAEPATARNGYWQAAVPGVTARP